MRPTGMHVIVDQVLAAKAFPNQSAVGKRILIRMRTPEPEWVEIIGVVAHQRDTSLAEPGREQIYFTDGFLGYGVRRPLGAADGGRSCAICGGSARRDRQHQSQDAGGGVAANGRAWWKKRRPARAFRCC